MDKRACSKQQWYQIIIWVGTWNKCKILVEWQFENGEIKPPKWLYCGVPWVMWYNCNLQKKIENIISLVMR